MQMINAAPHNHCRADALQRLWPVVERRCLSANKNGKEITMKNTSRTLSNTAKVKEIVLAGVAAAIICIFAPWKIPIGPIPITLATFAIYLVSALLGWRRGAIATAVYILLGAVGLPVFSGFMGGVHIVAGVTGGYVIGYIPLSLITGAFSGFKKRWLMMPIGMIMGTAALYVFGTAWYCIATGSAIMAAAAVCVLPFIPLDILKIAAATLLAASIKPSLEKLS